MHPTIFLSLLMGVCLGVAHSFMESETEMLTTAHLEKSSITAIPNLLLLSVQNIAVLATLSAFGIYTPAVIGIGIMTSNLQAHALSDSGGLNSSPSWGSSPLDTRRRRRAHPRDISAATPRTEDGSSYHVAEVLIRKLEKLGGQLTGKYPRFESPGHLPNLAALGKENQKKDESTDIESHNSFTNLNDKTPFPNSDLKSRQNDNTFQTKAASLVSRV
ncbi:hypothetical protein sscle_09g070180 [Sclerotinia sclerotiorum 1980 UF-70]|uniref:Uncharacterized protein n=1 Tax=Sclerotinia sclerotiorum (strain ATCC 18683 / 1980 / Ss-1) TaxID=665079 RepID=A0A1D9QBF9_SCLS1|nr:hypothetical protein sscle_09g070180 [Sclerotinia sclerotiorum 1980 UF-70]